MTKAVPQQPHPDRLEGADAIAGYLKGSWTPRKVYQAREAGWSIPIRKRDGIGIYAFKSELDAWERGDETLAAPQRA